MHFIIRSKNCYNVLQFDPLSQYCVSLTPSVKLQLANLTVLNSPRSWISWGKKSVNDVKKQLPVKNQSTHLLTIKEHYSFTKTLKKIHDTKYDFVLITKPRPSQMSAILLNRLMGKKFYWLQSFQNPPIPNMFTKLLLSQADRIIVKDRKDMFKLYKFGIKKNKVRIEN